MRPIQTIKLKVVGIDPGLAGTGIGIVEGSHRSVDRFAFGSITTSAKETQSHRLEKIYIRLCNLFSEEKPDVIIIEDVFSLEKYPKSGIVLGKVSGVVQLAGCRASAIVREVAVREAKRALTGNGNATKAQLEKAVRKTLGYHQPIRPFHASDALGLALIGLFRYGTPNCRLLRD